TAPLRISQDAGPVIVIHNSEVNSQVELVVYDFGAVGVTYRISLGDGVADLLSLSEVLYENKQLLGDSRRRVDQLQAIIQPALTKAAVSSFVEDYVIFQIETFTSSLSIPELIKECGPRMAQILRAETRELSEDEVTDALSHRISFAKDDVTIIDWNAALVF